MRYAYIEFCKQPCDGHLFVMGIKMVVVALFEAISSVRTSKSGHLPHGGSGLQHGQVLGNIRGEKVKEIPVYCIECFGL